LPEVVADGCIGLVSLSLERFLRRITQPEGDFLNPAYRSEGTSYA
jgi:hypothetical protein